MAKSDLLKEAIADAKAVKETALANAKIALQEAFAPRLERMLATKLTNEIEGEDEEMPVEDPEMDLAAGEEEAPMGDEGMEDDFNWTDDTLSAEVGGNEYDFQIGMSGEDEEDMEMPAEDQPMGNDEMNAEYGADDEDLNLEAIIRELEGDLNEEDYSDAGTDGDEIHEGDDYAADEKEMPVDESIDEIIEAILREEEEAEMPAEKEEAPAVEEAMKKDLEEAYATVNQLKGILSEVNLLNAKLLYTNKLFRNFELSENQKMKVIENFDRAGNTREVKLVFTTLAESFKRPTMKKRVVKESYASKPTATTAPAKESTQVLSEGFELANRWKKLAGLL
jgi:hypothetical protein